MSGLASAIFLEACPHEPASGPTEADRFCTYTHPMTPFQASALPSHVSVVPVHGNDRLRLLAVAGVEKAEKVVLRRNACLSCCLNVCRQSRSKVLVL